MLPDPAEPPTSLSSLTASFSACSAVFCASPLKIHAKPFQRVGLIFRRQDIGPCLGTAAFARNILDFKLKENQRSAVSRLAGLKVRRLHIFNLNNSSHLQIHTLNCRHSVCQCEIREVAARPRQPGASRERSRYGPRSRGRLPAVRPLVVGSVSATKPWAASRGRTPAFYISRSTRRDYVRRRNCYTQF